VSESVLFIDDQDRYDRLRLIAWWDQQRIRETRVLVVGAGALGNEVVKNLVLLGVGTIYLIDFDTIEASNLSRSVFFRDTDRGQSKAAVLAQRAQELNPDSRLMPIQGNVMLDLGLGLVQSLDCVIGCLDNREARLWVNRMCWKVGVPWIDGGIQELSGVVKVYQPPQGACYECTMTANDYRLIQTRYSCPLLKREDVQAGRVPTAPTIASMIGAWQVQELLKLVHGLPTDTGTALVFHGLANHSYKSKLPRRDDCLSHETYSELRDSDFTHRATVREVLAWGRDHVEGPATIVLDRDWVEVTICDICQQRRNVGRPAGLVTQTEVVCECGRAMRPVMRCEVDEAAGLDDLTMAQLGVPDWDIVKLQGPAGVEVQLSLQASPADPCPALPCSIDDTHRSTPLTNHPALPSSDGHRTTTKGSDWDER